MPRTATATSADRARTKLDRASAPTSSAAGPPYGWRALRWYSQSAPLRVFLADSSSKSLMS